MSLTNCQYCNKPLAECLESDKQYIQPFNHDKVKVKVAKQYIDRYLKIFYYVIGGYDQVNDEFYMLKGITGNERNYLDIAYRVSDCIMGTYKQYDLISIRLRIFAMNLLVLPLEQEYLTILFDLIKNYDNNLTTVTLQDMNELISDKND